jgi:hypothetical protein
MNSEETFDWGFFLKRAWVGPAVGILWLVNSISHHDIHGAILALLLGFFTAPSLTYIWIKRRAGGAPLGR